MPQLRLCTAFKFQTNERDLNWTFWGKTMSIVPIDIKRGSVYFRYFQTDINTIFTSNQCEKCASRIWCWDSNPRPSDGNSHPKTTRPWLPIYFNLPLIRLTSPFSIQSPIRIDFSLFSYLVAEKKFYNIDTRGRQLPTRRRRRRHTKYASNVSEWETWNEKCWKSVRWLTERLSYE